jgi:aminoglycoside/choline kinase family phosphotransferase
LVAKLAEGDEDARRRVAVGHRCEVGFYSQLAGTLAVRTPVCWYSAISDDAREFTLILEDLAPRTPGRQVEGCSSDQATGALRNLAALHAARWNDASLRDLDFLIPLTWDRAEFLGDLAVKATEQFVRRFASQLHDGDVATLREAAGALAGWQMSRSEPFALLHGDYRLDNLMFPPTGDDVVAVDWQSMSIGLPGRDLAYFIGTGLTIDQRRATEEKLVSVYHAELRRLGVKEYTAERCFQDYRLGQLHGPMITVIGCMTATGVPSPWADDMFLAMARRSSAAIRDLGSLDLI